MVPILRPRRSDIEYVETYLREHEEELAITIPYGDDYVEYEQFLGEVKTAMVIEAWMNEVSEADLLNKFRVQPGDRYSIVHNAQWLIYSAHELAKIFGMSSQGAHLRKLRERVKYGVSEQLLPLVGLKGIGRIRARILYNSGFSSIASLKIAPLQRLVELPLIGPRLAKRIKEQVGSLVSESDWKKLSDIYREQKSIKEYFKEGFDDID
jgi:helicase